jgi:oxalate decarboxylase/phosphoglucose isomerase-like protein (cupin superfamily)
VRLGRVRPFLAAVLLISLSSGGVAQVKSLFENDRVRVYEVLIKGGTKEIGFHRHSVPYVFYVLSGGRATVRSDTGTARAVEYKVGEVGWGEVESHAVDNVGTTDIRVLIVDLKTARGQQDPRDE